LVNINSFRIGLKIQTDTVGQIEPSAQKPVGHLREINPHLIELTDNVKQLRFGKNPAVEQLNLSSAIQLMEVVVENHKQSAFAEMEFKISIRPNRRLPFVLFAPILWGKQLALNFIFGHSKAKKPKGARANEFSQTDFDGNVQGVTESRRSKTTVTFQWN
jgi:hypothetical protein